MPRSTNRSLESQQKIECVIRPYRWLCRGKIQFCAKLVRCLQAGLVDQHSLCNTLFLTVSKPKALIPKCSRIMRRYFDCYKARTSVAFLVLVTNELFSTGNSIVIIPVLLARNSKTTSTELALSKLPVSRSLRLECRLLNVQLLAEKSAFDWVSRDTSFLLRKDSPKRL